MQNTSSIIEIAMEDDYTIFINKNIVTVNNWSIDNQCIIDINSVEKNIKKEFNKKNWEIFICELIAYGYLE